MPSPFPTASIPGRHRPPLPAGSLRPPFPSSFRVRFPLLSSLAALLALLCPGLQSCSEDPLGNSSPVPVESSPSETRDDPGESTLTLRFLPGGTDTRGEGDDGSTSISRVDVFEYDADGTYLEHFTLDGDGVRYLCFDRRYRPGTVRQYFVLANLGADCASHLEGLPLGDLSTEAAYIPLEGSGYRSGYELMAGSARCDFSAGGKVDIPLYRYMFKVSVESVTLDLEDGAGMNRDVFLRSISLINTSALYRLASGESASLIGREEFLFGRSVTPQGGTAFFGGLPRGYRCGPVGYGPDAAITYEGTPVPVYLNLNYRRGRGELFLDARGDVLSVTHRGFPAGSGEGRLASPEGTVPHTLTLGWEFLGIPQTPSLPLNTSVVSTFEGQGFHPRLVVELEVDGRTLFYPLAVVCPQPNTHYRISSLVLRGRGSDYSNFIEQTFRLDVTMSVQPWASATIPDMALGYQAPDKYSIH